MENLKVTKILSQINQEILKASKNNHNSSKALPCAYSFQGFAVGVLQVVLFTVL